MDAKDEPILTKPLLNIAAFLEIKSLVKAFSTKPNVIDQMNPAMEKNISPKKVATLPKISVLEVSDCKVTTRWYLQAGKTSRAVSGSSSE